MRLIPARKARTPVDSNAVQGFNRMREGVWALNIRTIRIVGSSVRCLDHDCATAECENWSVIPVIPVIPP